MHKLNRAQKKIYDNAFKKLEELGMKEEKDFSLFGTSESKVKNHGAEMDTKHFLKLQFRLKGNKKLIEVMKQLGWNVEKRYKNYDGNPGFYSSDVFGEERSPVDVIMVRMTIEI